jgi:hypothetical protein
MKLRILILLLFITFLLACSSPTSNDSTIVYITNSGIKYHKDGCQYLDASKTAISLKEACAKGYTPCSICKPPDCK